MSIALQLIYLFVLPIPIGCIAWTVTHEEVFREAREICVSRSKNCRSVVERKFFYLFTCEYCFSHYVVAAFLVITRYKLLLPDWRGYLIAGFALVWLANLYMGIYSKIRLDIKKERSEITTAEAVVSRLLDEEKAQQNPLLVVDSAR